MSLGDQTRQFRTEQGLTQAELATRSGLSRPTIARIEAGDDVSTATLAKVADVLDLRVGLRRSE